MNYKASFGSIREEVSPEEWQVRVDLAACYRLIERYGMTDLIYNHITARVPGPEHHLLINLYGLLYKEITASSLVKIDLEGNIVWKPDTDYDINKSGYVIHGAIHRERLVRDLGPHDAMILRSHGLLTCGATIQQAFNTMYQLEMSCRAQVDAMAARTDLLVPSKDVLERTAHLYQPGTRRPYGILEWPAMLRLLAAETGASGYPPYWQ